MSAEDTKSRKYELVAPDGGWGYMIGLGVTLNLATLTAFINCFGMLFNELFIEVNMDSTSITIFNAVAAFCVAATGFITSPLLKFISIRQLGLLAAFLFNLGIFCTVFVKSKLLFFVTQGIFQALGNGVIFNLSCTMLNNYFVKKRLVAFSFTQTISGVSALVSPQFVKWSLEQYGYRGTLLLISGISMHCILGMTLMQPVAWHMKKVEVIEPNEKEMESLLTDNKIMLEKSGNAIEKTNEHIIKDNKAEDHGNSIKKFFSRIIDFSIIRSFLLTNTCIGLSFTGCLDLMFIMLLPQALYHMGWNEGEVAKILSLNAIGDVVTRIVFIFSSSVLLKVGSHEMYVIGLVIAFVTRIGMLWSNNKTIMVIFITIMGISRCTIMILMPVVLADTISQDKYTAAMGMVLLSFGVANWTLGPLIGAIRDYTDSYTIAFYVLTSCFGVIIISWSTELFYKKIKQNKRSKMDASLIS